MNDLVTITDGSPVTTSLAIADGVDRPHKNIIELVRETVVDLEAFGPVAFETRKGKALPQGGYAKPAQVAILNEHQATLLITFMRNIGAVKEFKKRLVKAFFEMRDQLAKPRVAANDLSRMDILRLAMDAEEENLRLRQMTEEQKPKVEFHDMVVASEDAISVSEAAKILGTGRRRLFAFMRQHGWITRRNEPYQAKIEHGLMDVKLGSWNHPDHGLQQSVTALITGKGLAKLQRLYLERSAA